MREENLDALMLARNVNVFYTTGTRFMFVGKDAPSIACPQSATIITPDDVIYCGRFGPFDSDAVGLDTALVDTFEYYDNEIALADILKKYGIRRGDRIGTEWGQGPCVGIIPLRFEALRKRVSSELGAQFVDGTTAIWKMRSVKSKLEIERMRKAVEAAARAMGRIFDIIDVGMNELDVARKVSIFMLEEGADRVIHSLVMAQFSDGPTFHSCDALDRKIRRGYVSLDIGCKYKRYGSDINRGIMLGRKPTEDEKKLYECRVGVNQVMEREIKPGISMDEVLVKVNQYVREFGCKMQVMRGGIWGGHGIGLEEHEYPSIALSANQPEFQDEEGKVLFKAGMMFTFETPITLPGSTESFNVEDDIVVTNSGVENMNSMLSRELRVKL